MHARIELLAPPVCLLGAVLVEIGGRGATERIILPAQVFELTDLRVLLLLRRFEGASRLTDGGCGELLAGHGRGRLLESLLCLVCIRSWCPLQTAGI